MRADRVVEIATVEDDLVVYLADDHGMPARTVRTLDSTRDKGSTDAALDELAECLSAHLSQHTAGVVRAEQQPPHVDPFDLSKFHGSPRANTPLRTEQHQPPHSDEDAPPDWTIELAEEILRWARPTGSVFLRALVDEGGTATAARLRELTGSDALQPMTQPLSMAAATIFRRHSIDRAYRKFIQTPRDPDHPRTRNVHSYVLPAPLVPIVDEALRRLGR